MVLWWLRTVGWCMFRLWGIREKKRRGRRLFDFTGKVRESNESGASDRRSFVEQLESAFRTPARVAGRLSFRVAV